MYDLAQHLTALGSAALSGFWMPLLTWTIITAALLLVLHRWRGAHPLLHTNLRTGLLLMLPLSLVLVAQVVIPVDVAFDIPAPAVAHPNVEPAPFVVPPETASSATFTPPPVQDTPIVPFAPAPWQPSPVFWVGLATLLIGLSALVGLFLLVRDAWLLRRLRQQLTYADTAAYTALADMLAEAGRAAGRIRLAHAPDVTVPMTFGWWRPVIVVPEAVWQDAEALEMVVLHEAVHIRRGDYLRRWLERGVLACFGLHPLVRVLEAQIDRYREAACDAEVLARSGWSAHAYASLLLRFGVAGATPAPALRMARSADDLKHRLHALTDLDRTMHTLKSARWQSVWMALGLVALLATSMVVFHAERIPNYILAQYEDEEDIHTGLDSLQAGFDAPLHLENVTIYLDDARIHRSPNVVLSLPTWRNSYIYHESFGLAILSLMPLPEHNLRGLTEGNTLQIFNLRGQTLRIENETPFFDAGYRRIYVRHVPNFDSSTAFGLRQAATLDVRFSTVDESGSALIVGQDHDVIAKLPAHTMGLLLKGQRLDFRYQSRPRSELIDHAAELLDTERLSYFFTSNHGLLVWSNRPFQGSKPIGTRELNRIEIRTNDLHLTLRPEQVSALDGWSAIYGRFFPAWGNDPVAVIQAVEKELFGKVRSLHRVDVESNTIDTFQFFSRSTLPPRMAGPPFPLSSKVAWPAQVVRLGTLDLPSKPASSYAKQDLPMQEIRISLPNAEGILLGGTPIGRGFQRIRILLTPKAPFELRTLDGLGQVTTFDPASGFTLWKGGQYTLTFFEDDAMTLSTIGRVQIMAGVFLNENQGWMVESDTPPLVIPIDNTQRAALQRGREAHDTGMAFNPVHINGEEVTMPHIPHINWNLDFVHLAVPEYGTLILSGRRYDQDWWPDAPTWGVEVEGTTLRIPIRTHPDHPYVEVELAAPVTDGSRVLWVRHLTAPPPGIPIGRYKNGPTYVQDFLNLMQTSRRRAEITPQMTSGPQSI